MALTAILGGPGIHQMGYHFVLYPVLLNSVLLAALAILFNNLAGRRYPHALAPAEANRPICRSMPFPSPAPICTRR